MSRKIKVAAVQMDANPAPAPERLTRADELVNRAAQAGARLVVLPELFNTGYAYADTNFQLAEPSNGPTSLWLKTKAAQLDIHLAGSLMLVENGEIYNALLLYSPSGQRWRYDKKYPWAWERGYFRESRSDITVAHTELGDLGMLICWDVSHTSLWRQYAGRVDMMLIASCPPDGSNPIYHFPAGDQVTLADLGPAMAALRGSGQRVFGDMINEQTAWLGVPAVNTAGSGQIQTDVPRGRATLLSFLVLAPWLIKYLRQARRLRVSYRMIDGCKIVSATGRVLAERGQSQGEGFALAEAALPEVKPSPRGPQPAATVSWLAYFSADFLIPFLMRPVYAQGVRRVSSNFGSE